MASVITPIGTAGTNPSTNPRPRTYAMSATSRGRRILRNTRDPVKLVAAVRQGHTSDGGLAIDPVCRMAVDQAARQDGLSTRTSRTSAC